MAFGRSDDRDPLVRALESAAGLKNGTWDSVQACAMLSIEASSPAEAQRLYDQALHTSQGLGSGTWSSVQALAWLTRAGREITR